MAWDRDSRADVDLAENRQWGADRNLDYRRRQLDEATAELGHTRMRSYAPAVVWLLIGLTLIPFTKLGLDAGWRGNSGGMNPAWLFTFAGGFIAILAIVGIFDARQRRTHAPRNVESSESELAHAEEGFTDAVARVAFAIAEANAKAAHQKRVAGLEDQLVAIADYIGEVRVSVTGKKKKDDQAWADLAVERGWSNELAGLIRGVQEANGAVTGR